MDILLSIEPYMVVQRTDVIVTRYIQSIYKSACDFIGTYIVPYTTMRWFVCYTAYAGLLWGSVLFLWHFNDSNEIMSDDMTNPDEWYVSNAFNAWTSTSYMIAVPFTHIAMKIPLFSLTVSSFCLWSDPGALCRFIDVTSIHWVILGVMLQKTTSSYRYITHHILNVMFCAFIAYHIITGGYHEILLFYNDHITFTVGAVTWLNMMMTFNEYGFRPNILIGSMLGLLGFWCKFRDIFMGIRGGRGFFTYLLR